MQDRLKAGRAVPSGRLTRLFGLGSLATSIAGNMLADSARHLTQGKRPRLGALMLTPANAHRVADKLAHMRGAAMKVGQLLSMDAGDLLPAEISAILARLRADATAMPMSQVVEVLDANWGTGWRRHFRQFSFAPVAAASIGQVHFAVTSSGQRVAIKIQYPGVRQSIDSDIDNVAALCRLSGLIPRTVDFGPLLQQAKQQLHEEADYLREGAALRRYGGLLAHNAAYALPEVHDALTTESVLTMTRMDGIPIESLAQAPQAERDRIVSLLVWLLFRELFTFGLIQTDPNFANYRYEPETGRLILLDFGATREYSAPMVAHYRQILTGAIQRDPALIAPAAIALNYFDENTSARHRDAVLGMFIDVCEPLRFDGAFDFGTSDLAARLRDAGMALGMERDFWHTPQADVLLLHRKMAGLYLLAAKLRARVDVRRLWLSCDEPIRAAV
ncbi:ABC1 kinase family protein [Actimicrobium sp. GrIS 1.19]|uniref:ABC1 kinase family protein n=1 Tax=Actimicrobium sp. GrIS 1.19 TaxID=3071708 RepID=UPI002E12CF6D